MNSVIFFKNIGSFVLDCLLDVNNLKAQNILRRHHKKPDRPKCQCLKDKRDRKLVIRKLQKFILARFPGTGKNHAPWCHFYDPVETDSNGHVISQPAIRDSGDGLNIKISSVLKVTTKPSKSSEQTRSTNGCAGQTKQPRSSITLLGLLNVCLQLARINIWYPKRKYQRTFTTIKNGTEAVSSKITIGRTQLSKILVMPCWKNGLDRAQNLKQNQKILFEKTADSSQASIVIGVVNRWITSKKGTGAVGVGLNLMDQLLWMTPETARSVEISFSQLIQEISLRDRRILAIATVFRAGNFCTIGEIALMRTNNQFIPVDSGFELQVANELIDQNRKFQKPLRLEGDQFLPDFILLDCAENTVMEIFGIQGNAEYDEQKAKKIRYYRENNIPHWLWTPATEKAMSNFPKSSGIK